MRTSISYRFLSWDLSWDFRDDGRRSGRGPKAPTVPSNPTVLLRMGNRTSRPGRHISYFGENSATSLRSAKVTMCTSTEARTKGRGRDVFGSHAPGKRSVKNKWFKWQEQLLKVMGTIVRRRGSSARHTRAGENFDCRNQIDV